MMASDNIIPLNSWKGKAAETKSGFKKSMSNLMLFLTHIPELGNTVRWNELANRVEWNGRPLEDSDLVEVRLLLEQHKFEPTVADILPGMLRLSKENAFHPVRDYLKSLHWDGVARLDHWLQQCLGAPDTPFVRAVGRKTLLAAVARAFNPGCKVDTVLVLEGPQGLKKSTAIAALFGDQYTAESVNLFDQHNKMVMAMMGAWVVELAEFIAIQRKDQNSVKGMISMRSDRVVLPYAKMASDHPRQCVFFGTINPGDGGYLTDSTGNRRYWPVEVSRCDIAMITDRRDQIWAEATKAYFKGEAWWFENEEESGLAMQEVAAREKYDIWDEILHLKLIEKGIKSTTLAAALQEIGVPNERMDDRARDRAASCLRRLGFKSTPRKVTQGGERVSIRIYRRED